MVARGWRRQSALPRGGHAPHGLEEPVRRREGLAPGPQGGVSGSERRRRRRIGRVDPAPAAVGMARARTGAGADTSVSGNRDYDTATEVNVSRWVNIEFSGIGSFTLIKLVVRICTSPHYHTRVPRNIKNRTDGSRLRYKFIKKPEEIQSRAHRIEFSA